MQYYLLMPGDTEQDALNELNLLGESSFQNFWSGSALNILIKIIEEKPEMLKIIRIVNDKGQTVTTTDFLDMLLKLRVIKNK
jgi:hypothetical protein